MIQTDFSREEVIKDTSKEYLLTTEHGLYVMSSVANFNQREYHGLLKEAKP